MADFLKILRIIILFGILLVSSAGTSAAPALQEPPLAPDAPGQGRDVYDELFVGVPYEDLGAGTGLLEDAGFFHAIYGSSTGLTSLGNQLWSQDEPNVEDSAAEFEYFGYSLAAGDFNGDYRTDLAVGIGSEENAGGSRSGAFHLFYGTDDGLTANTDQIWLQLNSPSALAVGDFNRDGYADLAVGAAGANAGAGTVTVFPGSPAGLTVIQASIWDQDVAGVEDSAESGDNFGKSLAAGDFNRDSFVDLAIGVPGENTGPSDDAGAVNILYGSIAGITSTNDQIWFQGLGGIQGDTEADDLLGSSLTAADFNGDGYADLAVGAAEEDIGPIFGSGWDAGAVNVLYGSPAGLASAGNQFLYQGSPGLPDAAEVGDIFGFSLASGDFNGDGYSDLSIGVPSEDSSTAGTTSSGAMHVLYGSSTGLSPTGDQYWDEESAGVNDFPGNHELFSHTLAAGNFNGDGFVDLAVSTIWESLPNFPNPEELSRAGALNVLYGSPQGLDSAGAQWWNQDSSGMLGLAETDDGFGYTLASSACPTCRRLNYLPLLMK